MAKTLTVKTLARTMNARFQRIQFTPDLLPADITGTTVYNMQTGQFAQKKGPIFANLVLADEINRAPAKVQSALLEAMQERQVTVGDETERLPEPFLVMATQNPIEQEGTYALPEAQLDRFMLMIRVSYPSRGEERQIMDQMTAQTSDEAGQVASLDQVLSARRAAGQIYIDDSIRDYIIDVIQATRRPRDYGLVELEALIDYGASPRASDLPGPGGARPRVFAPPRLRDSRGCQSGGAGCIASPRHPDLRGRGGRDQQRRCGPQAF